MRRSLPWTIGGTIGLGLLALPLGGLVAPRSGAQGYALTPAWAVPWPSTPYRTAMREAGLWWAQAIQFASEERDDAQAALQAWDPTAPFDAKQELGRFLASDDGGYLKRALAALRTAEHLTSAPADKKRAERCRQRWEGGAHPDGRRADLIEAQPVSSECTPCRASGCFCSGIRMVTGTRSWLPRILTRSVVCGGAGTSWAGVCPS
jgi:hypothetical protein